MNKIKQKLAAGQVITMFNPDFASPRLVEYLGGLGLDVVWIDAERMSYDFERIAARKGDRAGGQGWKDRRPQRSH